ncbi:DUF6124 family protein [Pseudomonas gingeri]
MVKKITPDPPPPCRTSSAEKKAVYLSKTLHASLVQIISPPPQQNVARHLQTLAATAFRVVDTDTSNSLFSVQPGVNAQVALTQLSQLLKSVELNADEIYPRLDGFERDLLMHSVALSRTVVDALLHAANAPSHT